MQQVALGIYYLHSCRPPVLHLDLKSANVLLDSYGVAKVCDFGLARLKMDDEDGPETTSMGSPLWSAPEVLKGGMVDEMADTFSYGMLCFEVLSRELPYKGVPAAQVVMGVATGLLPRPELPEEICSVYPPVLADVMRRCWQEDPPSRPVFDEILDMLERLADEEDVML
uniref:Protein kinase domain-containing protein n=1 Tax=Haptolina ericina TaxID=156174 RepID=A0A7S3BNL9_9EUKA